MLLLIDPAQQTVGAADVCAGGYGKLQHLTSLRQISGVVEQLRPLLQGAHEKGVILVVLCQKVDVGRAVAKFQLRIADTCEVDDGQVFEREDDLLIVLDFGDIL